MEFTVVEQKEEEEAKREFPIGEKSRGMEIEKTKTRGDVIPAVRIWIQGETKEGRKYYYHPGSKVSVWNIPKGENDWVRCKDEKRGGKVFYYNAYRGESSWDLPQPKKPEMPEFVASMKPQASIWLECVDRKTGCTYFCNKKTKESQWQRPEGQHVVIQKVGDRLASNDRGGTSDERKSGFANDSSGPRNRSNSGSSSKAEENESRQRAASSASSVFVPGVNEDGAKRFPRAGSQEAGASECLKGVDIEYHDYVYKEGGGTSFFGRKNWKRRFMAIKDGKMGWFKSHLEFSSGASPLKDRWIALDQYRLEEMISDSLTIRLIPVDPNERVWNLRCDDMAKKQSLMDVLHPLVSAQGYVKSLHRHLSVRGPVP